MADEVQPTVSELKTDPAERDEQVVVASSLVDSHTSPSQQDSAVNVQVPVTSDGKAPHDSPPPSDSSGDDDSGDDDDEDDDDDVSATSSESYQLVDAKGMLSEKSIVEEISRYFDDVQSIRGFEHVVTALSKDWYSLQRFESEELHGKLQLHIPVINLNFQFGKKLSVGPPRTAVLVTLINMTSSEISLTRVPRKGKVFPANAGSLAGGGDFMQQSWHRSTMGQLESWLGSLSPPLDIYVSSFLSHGRELLRDVVTMSVQNLLDIGVLPEHVTVLHRAICQMKHKFEEEDKVSGPPSKPDLIDEKEHDQFFRANSIAAVLLPADEHSFETNVFSVTDLHSRRRRWRAHAGFEARGLCDCSVFVGASPLSALPLILISLCCADFFAFCFSSVRLWLRQISALYINHQNHIPRYVLRIQDAGPPPLELEVFENQRWYPFKDWTSDMLPSDRPPWSNATGTRVVERDRMLPPIGTQWSGDWRVDKSKVPARADADGWSYAFDFPSKQWGRMDSTTMVRRRRWVRSLRKVIDFTPPVGGLIDGGNQVPLAQVGLLNKQLPRFSDLASVQQLYESCRALAREWNQLDVRRARSGSKIKQLQAPPPVPARSKCRPVLVTIINASSLELQMLNLPARSQLLPVARTSLQGGGDALLQEWNAFWQRRQQPPPPAGSPDKEHKHDEAEEHQQEEEEDNGDDDDGDESDKGSEHSGNESPQSAGGQLEEKLGSSEWAHEPCVGSVLLTTADSLRTNLFNAAYLSNTSGRPPARRAKARVLLSCHRLPTVENGDFHIDRCFIVVVDNKQPELSVSIYENQRWYPIRKFSSSLLPTDRPPWSSVDGTVALSRASVSPPPGMQWSGPWTVQKTAHADSDGWMYAVDFSSAQWHADHAPFRMVRRRRWVRRLSKATHAESKSDDLRAPLNMPAVR